MAQANAHPSPAPSLGDICERLATAMKRCGGKFRITLNFGEDEPQSYITHWEKSGIYGAERPKNVSLGSLPEVLAGLERYVREYKAPRSHEEGFTGLVLTEERA